MILVDTSVWVDHLRGSDTRLAGLLDAGAVLIHPFVLGEIALGNLRDRTILALLSELPVPITASHGEVMHFIETNGLADRGIGYVDAHLLASARLTPDAALWTRDRRLGVIAAELGLAAAIPG